MAMAMVPKSLNTDWLSALQYASALSFPLAIKAASELGIFHLLSTHPSPGLSSLDLLLLMPPSSVLDPPRSAPILDRLLHLLSLPLLPSPTLPLLAVSPGHPPRYYLLPPAQFFVRYPDQETDPIGLWNLNNIFRMWDAYAHLPAIIREGGDGFGRAFGHHISHHVAGHAHEFIPVMQKLTSFFMDQFLDVWGDGFKSISSIVDVGGATGYALQQILDSNPHLTGINFDQPHVVASAPTTHPRLTHIGGDMLESVPSADAAFMKMILHDWEEDQIVRILGNCKRAISPSVGKVIAVEPRVADLDANDPLQLTNFLFMSSHGNKLRTVEEYKRLGIRAGFTDVKLACIVNEFMVLEFLS